MVPDIVLENFPEKKNFNNVLNGCMCILYISGASLVYILKFFLGWEAVIICYRLLILDFRWLQSHFSNSK